VSRWLALHTAPTQPLCYVAHPLLLCALQDIKWSPNQSTLFATGAEGRIDMFNVVV
jgi:hypothetical protein